jgi:hypothetical protein
MALVALVSGGLVFFYSTGPPGWPGMIGCIILQHQQGQSTYVAGSADYRPAIERRKLGWIPSLS